MACAGCQRRKAKVKAAGTRAATAIQRIVARVIERKARVKAIGGHRDGA